MYVISGAHKGRKFILCMGIGNWGSRGPWPPLFLIQTYSTSASHLCACMSMPRWTNFITCSYANALVLLQSNIHVHVPVCYMYSCTFLLFTSRSTDSPCPPSSTSSQRKTTPRSSLGTVAGRGVSTLVSAATPGSSSSWPSCKVSCSVWDNIMTVTWWSPSQALSLHACTLTHAVYAWPLNPHQKLVPQLLAWG